MSVAKRFKGYFLHGLAVLLPSILTIWLFVWGYTFIQNNISRHINGGIVHVVALATHKNVEISDSDKKSYLLYKYPELENNPQELEMRARLPENSPKTQIWMVETNLGKFWVKGHGSIVGFIIALIGVCVVGVLLASYVGKTLWRMAENFIMNTPILKSVYPYIKQLTDFFLKQEDKKQFFSRVVAVEYPRNDIWSLGFVTGTGFKNVANNLKKEFTTVFIPTSPTPFTGFVITVPKELVIDLDMSIEESFRFIVSGGVISPTSENGKKIESAKIQKIANNPVLKN
jgi:uncharacterized membrane protein